jgi:hypothetical protein
MRILNRVIVAGALVLPMTMAASGVALAEAPESKLPTQIAASDDDHHSDKCDKDGHHSDECDDDDDDEGGLLGGIL